MATVYDMTTQRPLQVQLREGESPNDYLSRILLIVAFMLNARVLQSADPGRLPADMLYSNALALTEQVMGEISLTPLHELLRDLPLPVAAAGLLAMGWTPGGMHTKIALTAAQLYHTADYGPDGPSPVYTSEQILTALSGLAPQIGGEHRPEILRLLLHLVETQARGMGLTMSQIGL